MYRYYASHVTCFILFSPPNNPTKGILAFSDFRWGSQVFERLSSLPKVTQVARGRARSCIEFLLNSPCMIMTLYYYNREQHRVLQESREVLSHRLQRSGQRSSHKTLRVPEHLVGTSHLNGDRKEGALVGQVCTGHLSGRERGGGCWKGQKACRGGDMKTELRKYVVLSSFTSRLIQKCLIMTTIEAGWHKNIYFRGEHKWKYLREEGWGDIRASGAGISTIWNPTEIWRPIRESQVSCQNIF